MSTEVLQEFLIKLGYKVDTVSDNRFSASITKMNKGVIGVGAAVVGMAFLAQKSMRDFASEMENLKYTSQLASSSANSINNASRAMEQFGFKPGQIEGILEGFAGMIAASPGLEAMMKSMGVALSPDKAKEFFNVMRKLEAMPEPVAIRTAAEFGVDISSYRLIRGHLGEISAKWKEIDAANKKVGNNLDQQAQKGREFNRVLSDIENQIDAISTKLLGVSIEKFGLRWVHTMKQELELIMGALGGSKEGEKEKLQSQAVKAGQSAAALIPSNVIGTLASLIKTELAKGFEEMRSKALETGISASTTSKTGQQLYEKTSQISKEKPLPNIDKAVESSRLGVSNTDNSVNVTNHNSFVVQGNNPVATAKETLRQLNETTQRSIQPQKTDRSIFDEKSITARNIQGGNS